MTKPLYIPNKDRIPGLKIFCSKCNRQVFETCRLNKRALSTCKEGEHHRFKLIIERNGKRFTQSLDPSIRDSAVAVDALLALRKKEKDGTLQKEKEADAKSEGTPILFIHAAAKFMSTLSGESAFIIGKRNKSKKHIDDASRAFKAFIECMKVNGKNPDTFPVSALGREEAELYFNHLKNVMHFGPRSMNKYLFYLTQFTSWHKDNFGGIERNWFEKVERQKVYRKPQGLDSTEEFELLLQEISFENGIVRDKKNQRRYHYADWLAAAFKFGLYTGRRREELVSARHSDIIWKNDKPILIRFTDFKVSRSKGLPDDNFKFNFNPVSAELLEFLKENGLEERKGSSDYILAPEKTERTKMPEMLTRSFAHFYSRLGRGKKSFGSLRKTFISSLTGHLKGDPRLITGHSGSAIIEGHYLDPKIAALGSQIQDFEVLSKERSEDINSIREKQKAKDIDRGISK